MKVMFIGDSLTECRFILEKRRWVTLVLKKLKISGTNAGIAGDTTGGMLARYHCEI